MRSLLIGGLVEIGQAHLLVKKLQFFRIERTLASQTGLRAEVVLNSLSQHPVRRAEVKLGQGRWTISPVKTILAGQRACALRAGLITICGLLLIFSWSRIWNCLLIIVGFLDERCQRRRPIVASYTALWWQQWRLRIKGLWRLRYRYVRLICVYPQLVYGFFNESRRFFHDR